MKRRIRLALLLAAALAGVLPAPVAWSADSAADEEFDEYAQPAVSDPFERVNRTMFKFNDSFYRRVLHPVANGYEAAVPEKARRGIANFFDNLRFPVRFVGCVLQGKGRRAAAETGKFLLNTTVGVGGFVRVSAYESVLRVPAEDTGQALGRWGLAHGPYLVLPVFGPSSLRDLGGRVGDWMLYPPNWPGVSAELDWRIQTTMTAADGMGDLPDLLRNYEAITRSAMDPYIAVRNGYLQYRDAAVRD